MSKVVLNDVTSGFNVSTINSNFDKIEQALNNKVLYRDNPVGEPNAMSQDLDMNGKRIYNLSSPQTPTEPVRLQDLLDLASPIGTTSASLVSFNPTGDFTSTNVQAALEEVGADIKAALLDTTSDTKGAGMVKFNPARNYAAQTIGWDLKQGEINIAWFEGADNTGVNDMTSLMNAALAMGQSIYLPKGTWKMNWQPASTFNLRGEGSAATFIRPFNTAIAAITAKAVPPQWGYATKISNLCFQGIGRVGVGFTCGQTVPGNYQPNDQIINNMRFEGVRFLSLEKGAQFPFGNIGVAFRSCGWTDNYYGVYCLNNKFGALMHAGNKYFYDSQFDSNICGVYVHNTAVGFGSITYTNTIFEYNHLDAYYYSNADMSFLPVSYTNCWTEGSGSYSTTLPVTVDTWSGTVKSTTSIPAYCVTIEGTRFVAVFENSTFSGINLTATNSIVRGKNVRVESTVGSGGQPCNVTATDSSIMIDGAWSNGGAGPVARMLITGFYKSGLPEITGVTFAGGHTILTSHRNSIGKGRIAADEVSVSNFRQTNMSGSWSLSGTVVADGVLFQRCNEYTIPFTASPGELVQVIGTGITTTAGWYVATVDVKVLSGNPYFSVWDRNTANLMAAVSVPLDNAWHTLAAIGYSPGSQSLFFDIGKNAPGTSVVRMSAYQCRRFDTEHEAQAFLASGVYKQPSNQVVFGNNVGAIANGTAVVVPCTVNGALLGDSVAVTSDVSLAGLTVTAHVTSDNNVNIVFDNRTGASVTLPTAQYYIDLTRP